MRARLGPHRAGVFATIEDLEACGVIPDILVNPDGTIRLAPGYEELRQSLLTRLGRQDRRQWADGLALWLRLHTNARTMTGEEILYARAVDLISIGEALRDRVPATPRA